MGDWLERGGAAGDYQRPDLAEAATIIPNKQPESGLGLARAVAMLSYRSFDSLEAKFGRQRVSATRNLLDASFEIESYLAYQGVKLVQRFDANTYLYITKAMDDYDLAEGRGRLEDVLKQASPRPPWSWASTAMFLYPEVEQRHLVEYTYQMRLTPASTRPTVTTLF